jgi:hypothetical protein
VIDVGVGQNDGIDCRGPKWKWTVVQLLFRLWALKQAAVHKDASLVCFEQKT